jgi:hypothetical protein
MNDGIVKQVRDIREQHAKRLNYDLDRIFTDLKNKEKQHVNQGWKIVSPPDMPPNMKDLSLQRTRFGGN